MGVPIRYNLRSLFERKATTIMTAFGIALTVAVLVISLALMAGLRATFAATGHPLQAVVVRKGLTSELASSLTHEAVNEIRAMPQLERDATGLGMASPEMVSVISLASVDSPTGMNVGVRGLLPIGANAAIFALSRERCSRRGSVRSSWVLGSPDAIQRRDRQQAPLRRAASGRWLAFSRDRRCIRHWQ